MARADVLQTHTNSTMSTPSCLHLQINELGVLQSMFTESELSLDEDCKRLADLVPSSLNSERTSESNHAEDEFEDVCLGLDIKKVIDEQNRVEIRYELPAQYPVEVPPNVLVRTDSFLCKQSRKRFMESMRSFIDSIPLGEPMIYDILLWIADNIGRYLGQGSRLEVNSTAGGDLNELNFSRLWLYSHHLYSKIKRQKIINWAIELGLHGFSMSGKPGIICVEGDRFEVDEFWSRIRKLSWKRLFIKEREEFTCTSLEEFNSKLKFGDFEEVLHTTKSTNSFSFHSDLGQLRNFLQQHDCDAIFEVLFDYGKDHT